MSDARPDRPSAAHFPTTCWSLVVAAGGHSTPEARDALAELCAAYWYPLYAFVRRRGHGPEEAADLVQDLFAGLLGRDDLPTLDPSRGKFRSFLMACCAHLIGHRRDRERAVKRGGGRAAIPLDRLDAEARFRGEPGHGLTAERLFERTWALTLLDRALGRVDAEMARSAKAGLYRRLRPALLGQEEAPPYREVAAEFGLSEGAVKAAAHRLRGRYREALRAEVARTVSDPAEVDSEIDALIAALAR